MRARDQIHDTDRTLGDVVRLGTVKTVDLAAARVTVQAGDLVTGPVPWTTPRGGAGLRIWSPPRVGEQVMLVCPEGELAAGVVMGTVWRDQHPAPASDDAHSLHFEDGTVLRYDAAAKLLTLTFADGAVISYDGDGHALSAVLPSGGTAVLTADGGITITGDVTIDGNVSITGDVDVTGGIEASDDIVGDGISLHDHVHGQVKAGTDQSGAPA